MRTFLVHLLATRHHREVFYEVYPLLGELKSEPSSGLMPLFCSLLSPTPLNVLKNQKEKERKEITRIKIKSSLRVLSVLMLYTVETLGTWGPCGSGPFFLLCSSNRTPFLNGHNSEIEQETG